MRKCLMLLLALFCIVSSLSSAEVNYKRYGLKSAMVEYQYSGNQKGTNTLYFDNYGRIEAQYSNTEVSMMGFSSKQNSVTIIDGLWQYSYDADKKTGTKMKNTLMEDLLKNNKDLEDLGAEMSKRMGGKMTGHEEFLGKSCDVWEFDSLNSKMWIWKMIPLKLETNMFGMQITQEAVKIEENVAIPAGKFKVPPDVKLQEVKMDTDMEDLKQLEDLK